jgi:Tol biopolymer transport system component
MKIASLITAAAVVASLSPARADAQGLPRDPAERAKVIAQILEVNARQLTLFDRRGQAVGVVGPRDLYNQPVLSPDGKRLAVIKNDLDKESNDLWVIDVATARGTQMTTSKMREGVSAPAWSPDSTQVAYVALRDGYFGVYRKGLGPQGQEELLLKNSAPLTVTDWSQDGKYLTYFSTDLGGGGLFALPTAGTGERKPIEILRNKFQLQGPRLSPDSRAAAFVSNLSGRNEIYVVPFDANAGPGTAASVMPLQVSDQGGAGMVFWRRDGRELLYLAADRAVMSVAVESTAPAKFGKPRVLFRPSADIAPGLAPGTTNVSRDGERFVFAVPRPQLRQLTVFDRSGKAVATAGQPGSYVQPNLSPDGSRALVMRNDPRTGNQDIWVIDLATGSGTAITDDVYPDNAPIWSPDGRHVAYVSMREGLAGIYRKAADGTGGEELLFQYTPGAGMVLTDWSPDGKFITFYTGVIVLVPVATPGDAKSRKEIDWLREDYEAAQGRFSPDGRYMAYVANEENVDRLEVYVRPFDASKPDAPPPGKPVKVSKEGANGMVTWRQDGKELYFISRDWEVMAVDIATAPTLSVGTPRLLFKMPGPLPGNPLQWKNVSKDGQRFIFSMPSGGGAPAPAR